MSQPLRFVKSLPVTPAMLTGTNVPENDYPEWDAGATYAKDERVIVAAQHKVYQSLQPGNVGKSPVAEPTWWIEVGPTNRWRLLDLSNSTQTTAAANVFYEITPGIVCNAVCVLNVQGALNVRVRVTDPTFGVMYDKTTSLVSVPDEASWFAWFFGERTQQSQFIALDLPSYPNATIRVDIEGTPSIGVLMVGQVKSIGVGVRLGTRLGIQDYSIKDRNKFGDSILLKGEFAKRASFTMLLKNSDVDATHAMLADVRATPCLWIGMASFTATIIFGFYREFEISIPYRYHSECTLDLEGLT